MATRTKRRSTRRAGCPDCRAALSHCHDTLIVHADGSLECTKGAACVARTDRHERVVTCEELERCGCLERHAAG